MQCLQKAFLNLTALLSWKEAEQQFPQWTSDEILRSFYPLFSNAKAAGTIFNFNEKLIMIFFVQFWEKNSCRT